MSPSRRKRVPTDRLAGALTDRLSTSPRCEVYSVEAASIERLREPHPDLAVEDEQEDAD